MRFHNGLFEKGEVAGVFYGGELLGETYQIIREIGRGGTGVVYLAWHTRLGKEVIVKRIYENFVGRMNVRAEVDILKGLHHTGLPQVYDFLQVGSDIYTVMEYIKGNDLQYYLDNGYQFNEKQLMRWLQQLCAVLDYLHTRNPVILHSDIKPGNIMITPEGNICLIDFNISLDGQNNSGLKGLSENYAAPEQHYKAKIIKAGADASQVVLDERMDIYSLGATFYSLMTGMLPELEIQRMYPIESLNIGYSDGLKRIIGRAMSWNPSNRFDSAKAMLKVLVNTYKYDGQYKRSMIVRMVSGIISALFILIGIWSSIYGWKQMNRDSYEEDYIAFITACNQFDNDEIIDGALTILNENKYERFLAENLDDKARILNSMGDAYFEQGYFGKASEYYEQAQDIAPDNSLYYCNQAISEARNMNLDKASNILAIAGSRGVDGDDILLAEQEIAYCQEDYTRVVEIGNSLAASLDADIVSRSCLLNAKAYYSLGNISLQNEYLDRAYASSSSIRCLRELGKSCLDLSQLNTGKAYTLLQKSEECYRVLWESPYAAETDGLNLAIALELLERYNESLTILKQLEQSGTNLYQVYMHMTYILIQSDGSLSEAQRCYTKAEQLYRKQQVEDESFELLENLLDQRINGGD